MEIFKPNVSEDFAKKLVRKLYGLEVLTIKRMNSYDDQNFHIQVSQTHNNNHINSILDTGYTLKITNTEKSAITGHFDSMHATMIHLHERGVRAPIPLKNLKGSTWSLEKVPLLNEEENDNNSTKSCGIHILTFLPGVPLSTSDCSKDILYQWGVLLGKFHNATQDFVCPELQNKYVLWNLENVQKVKEYMHVLPAAHQTLVDSVLSRYPDEIETYLPHFPKGVIHGDFNENNVLVQKQNSECCSTWVVDVVLDFEDVHEGTYTWDVAVMMMYAMIVFNEEGVLDAPGHALAGYLTERTLNHLELKSLKMCIECRFCQSLVYGAYSYSRDPLNVYLLESSKTGWAKLKTITSERNEDLLQRWENIAHSWMK